ncbi:anti-sigma factor, partial [Frankia sp. Cpl3]|nr:anti-sigma factor [Frankia sp. Cpl3]
MYIIGECSDAEKEMLAKHIEYCPACRLEWEQLQQTWQSIPLEPEEMEPPADLKAEVMTAIFADSPASKAEIKQRKQWKDFFQLLLRPSQGWVTAALLLALGVSLLNNWTLREQLIAVGREPAVPAQLVQEYTLRSTDTVLASAKGNAWLLQQGERKRLVFHLQGLRATQGTEAYQIWLIHDGKRSSAGVFHVDPSGNG